jgi:hypothetical protein
MAYLYSIRRTLIYVLLLIALLGAGMVAIAPAAWAHGCTHTSHGHWHDGHSDYYHYHSHETIGGVHYHVWHNHTHGNTFTVSC